MRLDGSALIGSFQVVDAAGVPHNGLALDQATVQPYLDVLVDPDNVEPSIQRALWRLMLAEYGSLASLATALISQAVQFAA